MNIATNDAQIQPRVSRRSMITAALASAALVTPAQAFIGPAPTQPDPHPDWFEEWKKNDAAWAEIPEGPEVEKALWSRRKELEHLLVTTPAATSAGIAAKIAWVLEDGADYWGCSDHELAVRSVLADLMEAA